MPVIDVSSSTLHNSSLSCYLFVHKGWNKKKSEEEEKEEELAVAVIVVLVEGGKVRKSRTRTGSIKRTRRIKNNKNNNKRQAVYDLDREHSIVNRTTTGNSNETDQRKEYKNGLP